MTSAELVAELAVLPPPGTPEEFIEYAKRRGELLRALDRRVADGDALTFHELRSLEDSIVSARKVVELAAERREKLQHELERTHAARRELTRRRGNAVSRHSTKI